LFADRRVGFDQGKKDQRVLPLLPGAARRFHQ
jgi:hypothetical protein